MASVIKDPGGRRRIQFVGRDNKRKTIRLGKITHEAALGVKVHVERLVQASVTAQPLDKKTAGWVAELDSVLHTKLAIVGLVQVREEVGQATLKLFLDAYVAKRSDVKDSTATVYGHTHRCLVNFFGAEKPLREINLADADDWRIYLQTDQKLADNTVRRRCGIAK
jgi:hypothetical protein